MNDFYNLERFVIAQDKVYNSVVVDLKNGEKTGCWMWYVFPQIKGLGMTMISQEYAISGKEEAIAYFEHPILGERLKHCTKIIAEIKNRSIREIFGYPDNLKFRSCMTLFDYSLATNTIFQHALLQHFKGEADQLTIDILEQ